MEYQINKLKLNKNKSKERKSQNLKVSGKFQNKIEKIFVAKFLEKKAEQKFIKVF